MWNTNVVLHYTLSRLCESVITEHRPSFYVRLKCIFFKKYFLSLILKVNDRLAAINSTEAQEYGLCYITWNPANKQKKKRFFNTFENNDARDFTISIEYDSLFSINGMSEYGFILHVSAGPAK